MTCLLATICLSAMNLNAFTNVLVDFRANASVADWEIVNDGVMGGVSSSRFARNTDGYAVFSGEVSLENNGGFASVRTQPRDWQLPHSDAFVLRVRGDGKRYKFTARMSRAWDSPQYQAGFVTRSGEWQEIRLPISGFQASFRGRVLPNEPPLDPTQVTSIGFLIADQQAGPFRLEIEDLRIAGPPTAQPAPSKSVTRE
jgi:monofunctional biosynthetic peptidoglycan transglycosylase